MSIQVDKHGLDIFKLENRVSTLSLANPKLCLMKSSMKKSGFGFQTLEIKKTPKSFILE